MVIWRCHIDLRDYLAPHLMTGEQTLPEMPDPADGQNRAIGDDDAGFVARCRRGDTDAFAVLVRRHQKKMLNIAYRMIGDYDNACEVAQESFLSAYRRGAGGLPVSLAGDRKIPGGGPVLHLALRHRPESCEKSYDAEGRPFPP